MEDRLGDFYKKSNDKDIMLFYYHESLKHRQQIYQKDQNNALAQLDLAVGFSALGDAYKKLHENHQVLAYYQALGYYKQALAMRKQLFEKQPDNVESKRELSVSYLNLADLFMDKNKFKPASEYYNNALKIREEIANQDLNNIQAQYDMSFIFYKLGLLERKQKNKHAREWFEKMSPIVNQLDETKIHYKAQEDLKLMKNEAKRFLISKEQ